MRVLIESLGVSRMRLVIEGDISKLSGSPGSGSSSA